MRAYELPSGAEARGWGLLIAGIAAWLVSLRPIGPADLTDYGLISALPPLWWIGLGLVSAAFASAVTAEEADLPLGIVAIVAAAVLLYGTPAVVEPLPRFNTVYVHLGLIEAITRNGHLFPELDARFSWPLFFVAAGMISAASGVDLMAVAAWVPLGTVILALPAIWMLTRAFTEDRRLALGTAWVLVFANWVGQDYLSPQGLNFVLYLWFVALLATYFGRRGPHLAAIRRRLTGLLGEPLPSPPVGAPDHPAAARAGMLLLATGLVAISVASHQLTPFAMVGASAGLVLVGATRVRSMPILVAVMAGLWVAFAGYTYLAGHLGTLVSDIGDPTGTAGSGVVSRVRGSEGHLFVVLERIVFSIAFWALAALGALRRLRAGHWDVVAVMLAAFPFGLIALQSYGGEIFLRVFLFALPAMSFLAAAAVAPLARLRPWANGAILVAVSLALAGGFILARYGNERADLVTTAELAVVDRTLEVVPPGSVIASLNYNSPLRYRLYEEFSIVDIVRPPAGFTAADVAAQLDEVRDDRDTWLLVTRGQRALEELLGSTPAQLDELVVALDASPRFEAVYRNEDGTLYRLLPAAQP